MVLPENGADHDRGKPRREKTDRRAGVALPSALNFRSFIPQSEIIELHIDVSGSIRIITPIIRA